MEIELRTSLACSTSEVQDEIRGRLTLPLSVDGVEVVPAGATVRGVVTEVERSGRVKGLARLAFRFSVLEHPTTGSRVGIRTATIIREAKAAKKKDAATIDVQIPSGSVVAARLEEPFLVRIPAN
jgi:hypothetical protein